MRNLVILGSTGSIGQQVLDVVRLYPKEFRVIGLSTKSNRILLAQQREEFSIPYASVTDDDGADGLIKLATLPDAYIVVNALSGLVGVEPTIAALKARKKVALANKESLVAAGDEILQAEEDSIIWDEEEGGIDIAGQIIPIDSEHSALFQLCENIDSMTIEKFILPCSGGPFYGKTAKELKNVTPEQALNHPKWKMGKKISIDSATLINKGFELIEACKLFSIPPEKVEVVIHPESVVHGMIRLTDGQIFAHMAPTDMRHMIEYALFYPNRPMSRLPKLSFEKLHLTFEKPDEETFVTLPLARKAAGLKNAPRKLVEADEKAVELFLKREISFLEIFDILKTSI